jgi:undecaprenyl-diphosphatase
MSPLDMIILAIVQGITEFLPISSDGHLVLANELLQALGRPKPPDQHEVTLVLPLGTLAEVLVFYRREIIEVLTTRRRAIPALIIATIPAVIIGLFIEKGLPDDIHDYVLESPLLAGIGFLITAAALWWGIRAAGGTQDYPDVRPGQALIIGLFQAAAILPGVSRSGLTIGSGLATGLKREAAAAFSFLLAIPVIAGAGGLTVLSMIHHRETGGTPVPTLALGFIVAMLVGLAALAFLLHMLKQGRLIGFVYYLIPLGIATIIWQLAR